MSPLICYAPKTFSAAHVEIIDSANAIIDEYAAAGYDLTLRQVYYQFVARGLVANTVQSYKRLGGIINDARLAGLIDWHAIEDRTRNLAANPHWDNPAGIIKSAAYGYGIDTWEGQDSRCEVWVEKEALAGVVARPAKRWDVPYFSCRGYVSQSEMWSAAMRLKGYVAQEQHPVVIHLGDHDPSGIDMTRDIQDRLEMFVGQDVTVHRIALNMDQVDEHSPPPNPAKVTDSRFEGYSARYGDDSWELDALEPSAIEDLIDETVADVVNMDLLTDRRERQEDEREQLTTVSKRWADVVDTYCRNGSDPA